MCAVKFKLLKDLTVKRFADNNIFNLKKLFNEQTFFFQQKHRKEHKSEENRTKCHICNFDPKDEKLLAEHIEMHEGLSPLQCVICKKVFQHKRNISPHMRLHVIQ